MSLFKHHNIFGHKYMFWGSVLSLGWNLATAVIFAFVESYVLMAFSVVFCLTSAGSIIAFFMVRNKRRKKILEAIKEAKRSNAYEISEHLTSKVSGD